MKISVLTATYNRKKLLERLYESLVNNTKYDVKIEWLIMDDGSTDDTEQIVKKFQEDTDNENLEIKYYKQENQHALLDS